MNHRCPYPRVTASLALSMAVLAGCGGGGVEYQATWPVPLVEQTVTASSGGAGPAGGFVVAVQGPAFTTSRPAAVQVCASGSWVQQLTRSAAVGLRRTITAPLQGQAVAAPVQRVAGAQQVQLPFDQCAELLLPSAGTYPLQLLLELSTDCGCTEALAGYSATVRWTVRAQYEGI